MKIEIKENCFNNLDELIRCLQPIYDYDIYNKLTFNIHIPESDFVYPEYLITIVGAVKFVESKGIQTNIIVNNPGNNRYVSRINFYQLLGVDYNEDFTRHNSEGRFVEITHVTYENTIDVANDITKVIRNKCNIDETVLRSLSYCLNETLDNIQLHAESEIDGFVVSQNYERKSEIKIVILDGGIGIYNSLTNTAGSKYYNLTPKEALEECIKSKVTNGNGGGNGLYHTSQFIIKNRGDLIIHSGDYKLVISNGSCEVVDSPYWQGTMIYMRINNDVAIDYNEVFGENIPVTIDEFEECINQLW